MTNVRIEPGICNLTTRVSAKSEDGIEVTIHVASACAAVKKMFDTLGDTFDAYEICLCRPGCGPLYEYAAENFPAHCACPAISGITKAVEAECKLALARDVTIKFE